LKNDENFFVSLCAFVPSWFKKKLNRIAEPADIECDPAISGTGINRRLIDIQLLAK